MPAGQRLQGREKRSNRTVNWRRELYLGMSATLSSSLAAAAVVWKVFDQSLWDDAALSGVDSLNEK